MTAETSWNSPIQFTHGARQLAVAGCVLSVVLLLLTGSVNAAPAERIPLTFPEIEPPPPGKRTSIGQRRFFNIVYAAPLERQTEVLLTKLQPQLRTQRSPQAEARWLSNFILPVATLLQPSDSPQMGTIGQAWQEDTYLYQQTRYLDLFTEPVMAAIAEAPPVLVCSYDQGPALPPFERNNVGSLGSLWKVKLAFWTSPVPEAIAPKALREFRGPEKGMHPLIIVGPPINTCPETLGLALEVMATQFPGQIPAAQIAALDEDEEASHLASSASGEDVIARLTGMSVSATQTIPARGWGAGDFIVVDRLDPEGPAARAGFRSGDYLRMIGWSHHTTIDAFAEALVSATNRKAAVLSRLSPGLINHKAALVVFADTQPGQMVEILRGAAPGRMTLAERPWQTISVAEDSWCGVHVEVLDALDIGVEDGVPNSASENYGKAIARIREDCPEAETISILRISSQTNAPVNVLKATLASDSIMQRAGIDGLPPGDSVRSTRAIALAQAPLCDRLATHPADPERRYGLEGKLFIDASSLEEAFEACLAAVEAKPEDIVSRFHLGRVLHAGGLHQQALNELRIAADSGHGGALDLLGQMHLMGDGVSPDLEAARSFFRAARTAGFAPSATADPAIIDLTGVTLPGPVREVFELAGSMYIAMDPEFKGNVHSAYRDADDRGYLVRMLSEIAALCGAEQSVKLLQAARSSGVEDTRDVDHALFLYTEYLPPLLPRILARAPRSRYASEGSRESVAALVDRYDCLSLQLRQFAINTAEMALQ